MRSTVKANRIKDLGRSRRRWCRGMVPAPRGSMGASLGGPNPALSVPGIQIIHGIIRNYYELQGIPWKLLRSTLILMGLA